jgi:hypothetical protein
MVRFRKGLLIKRQIRSFEHACGPFRGQADAGRARSVRRAGASSLCICTWIKTVWGVKPNRCANLLPH